MSTNGIARRTQHQAGWIPALLLLAVLLRGLVPMGWMPAIGLGGPQLVICTTSGLAAAPADMFAPGGEQAPPKADHSPCAFAGLGVPLLPATVAIAFSHALEAREGSPPTGPPALLSGSSKQVRPPAQAPPTFR